MPVAPTHGKPRVAGLSGHPFPSPDDEWLLKASLLKGETAIASFLEWKTKVDFDKDIGSGAFRLLPLLYHNLREHGVSDGLMPRLKGIYRQSWTKNNLLFHQAGKIISFLETNGIKTLVMKGIPLSLRIYKNRGVRPMADVDVLIPFSEARPAIELLLGAGWSMYEPQFLEYNLKYGRSATFANAENTELGLHWHPVFESHGNITEEDFWSHAVPFDLDGVQSMTFCETDHLFHTIVHGLRYNPEAPIRWVADSVTLLNEAGRAIGWQRLMRHTLKFRVQLQMKMALNYLVEHYGAGVPDGLLHELRQTGSTYADRLVYRHAMTLGDRTPLTLVQKLFSVYAGFLRQTNRTGFWSQHCDFIRYLRFRTKGKPWARILAYHFSKMFQNNRKTIEPGL